MCYFMLFLFFMSIPFTKHYAQLCCLGEKFDYYMAKYEVFKKMWAVFRSHIIAAIGKNF